MVRLRQSSKPNGPEGDDGRLQAGQDPDTLPAAGEFTSYKAGAARLLRLMDRLLRQDPWWFNRAKDGKACGDAISLTPRQELFPGSIADLRNDIGMPVLLCKQWRFLDLSHFPSH